MNKTLPDTEYLDFFIIKYIDILIMDFYTEKWYTRVVFIEDISV
jgi:hypothetical protein